MNLRHRRPAAVPSRARGFTLMEMLAVIVLLGIVATIVVTQVGKNVERGRYDAGKTQLAVVGQAIDSYAMDNGTPPPKLEDLVTRPPDAPHWNGPYLKPSQLEDPFGHAFGYRYPGAHGSYDLIFYGADGKAGGNGFDKDVGNWE